MVHMQVNNSHLTTPGAQQTQLGFTPISTLSMLIMHRIARLMVLELISIPRCYNTRICLGNIVPQASYHFLPQQHLQLLQQEQVLIVDFDPINSELFPFNLNVQET